MSQHNINAPRLDFFNLRDQIGYFLLIFDQSLVLGTLLLPVPPSRLLLLPLPLRLPVPLPGPLPVGRGDGLDGVGGERPHVADRVQQVGPGHQLGGDLRAAGLEPLPATICC